MTAPADAACPCPRGDEARMARLRSVLDNLADQSRTDETLTVRVVLNRRRIAIDTAEETPR